MVNLTQVFKGVNTEVFDLSKISIIGVWLMGKIHSPDAHHLWECERENGQTLNWNGDRTPLNLFAMEAKLCDTCFSRFEVRKHEVTSPYPVRVGELAARLRNASKQLESLKASRLDTLKRSLNVIAAYKNIIDVKSEEPRFRQSHEYRALVTHGSKNWAARFDAEIRPTYQKAIEVIRNVQEKEFLQRLAAPLCKVTLPDGDLFPEARKRAEDFARDQLNFLLEDDTVYLTKVRRYWSTTQAVESIPEIYGPAVNDVLVVPAAVAAFLTSKEKSADVAKLPKGASGEELSQALEAVGVLYRPDDTRGAYSTLQAAVDAALAL